MRLALIRHGATEWSVDGRHTGRTDLPLTAAGEAEARDAAPGVARMLGTDLADAVIFSSPLTRALTTARSIFPGREVHLDDDLMEFDYGDYEGLTSEQIRERVPDWDLWTMGCPGGETVEAVGTRADHFLVRAGGAGPVVVVVAHAHLLRILAARAVGLGPETGGAFTLDTATVSIIEDVRGRRVVRRWNVDPRG